MMWNVFQYVVIIEYICKPIFKNQVKKYSSALYCIIQQHVERLLKWITWSKCFLKEFLFFYVVYNVDRHLLNMSLEMMTKHLLLVLISWMAIIPILLWFVQTWFCKCHAKCHWKIIFEEGRLLTSHPSMKAVILQSFFLIVLPCAYTSL